MITRILNLFLLAATGLTLLLGASQPPAKAQVPPTPSATLPPPGVTQIVLATATTPPTATLEPTAIATKTPEPRQFGIGEVVLNYQGSRQARLLSCEANGAETLIRYLGGTQTESQIQKLLPQSDNPNLGFVGNVDAIGPNVRDGYGVHADPLAEVLKNWGYETEAYSNQDANEAAEWLAETVGVRRFPVMIWATIDLGNSFRLPTRLNDGSYYFVWKEHTPVVFGVRRDPPSLDYPDGRLFFLYNPGYYWGPEGGEEIWASQEQVVNAWRLFDYMALVVTARDQE